jgi:hypothetical protein
MATGPAARSLKHLRDEGWPLVQVVEQWIPQARKRRDLYGFCDILAVHPRWGHLYVQATSGSNVSARLKKIRECEAVGIVLEEGSKVTIHGWRKVKRNGRKVWRPRILDVGLGEYYSVDNNDWDAIRRIMETVDFLVPRTDAEGYIVARATLEDYPPRIEIVLTTNAGEGDQRSSKFTNAELSEASDIVQRMTEKAIERYPWLKVANMYPGVSYGKGYVLKPRSYSDLAELAKSWVQ